MPYKPGTKLRSVADTTEVVVIRAPAQDVDLRCGGHPMTAGARITTTSVVSATLRSFVPGL